MGDNNSIVLKICPLLAVASAIHSGFKCGCLEDRCGFWMAAAGKCSVPVIAGALGDIEEKMNG